MKGSQKTGGKFAANIFVGLRLTPEDKTRLMETVAVAGISLSEYVRRRLFGGRPVISRTDEAVVRELRRLGGLLKCNFEILRQAGGSREILQRQEDTLEKLAAYIDILRGRDDRQEGQIQEFR